MSLSLGVDIGTSGVRTAVLESDGTVLSHARAPHVANVSSAIDANDWWTATAQCLRAQVSALADIGRSGEEIRGIAIDGTSGSMVLTDAYLVPVGPALMYNSKGFVREAERVEAACPTGEHITKGSNSALARALRLLKTAERAPAHLLHQADFIAAKLMGRGGLSDHNNALKTGFDPGSADWPAWIADLVGPSLLPHVDPVGTAWAHVDPSVAADLGLSPSCQVHAGTTDSIAAFLAAAPLEDDVAVTSIGSTLAIKVLSKQRVDVPSMGLYAHRVRDFWLVGGASNTGGAVLAHFFSTDDLERLSADIDPDDPTGLDYYPLLEAGERFPVNDPDLRPRLTPRPVSDVAFLQGLFEGIARIEAQSYALIAAQGGPMPSRIYSAGGASKNTALTQIRQRALGVNLPRALHTEASIGAASLTGLVG